MLFDISDITIDILNDELFVEKQVTLSVLRLDKIHPVVSGNKMFKLHYFLEEALLSTHKTVLTFGGAYSNHLAATAFSCMHLGLKSIGIIRGEKPETLSSTLQQCIACGMRLQFISRKSYDNIKQEAFIDTLKIEFGECIIIPEGGYHTSGVHGAGLILNSLINNNYSHICTAVGTTTTMAGLLKNSKKEQMIVGIPVLKGMADIKKRLEYLIGDIEKEKQLILLGNYHFGGYAKKTASLIAFMNECWIKYQLPLDFVYTAKMFYAIYDGIKNNYYQEGSNILCVHTGGLQGNNSLPGNTLLY